MDGFSSDTLAAGERKAGYEGALRAYFGVGCAEADIRVHLDEADAFAASIEPVALGTVRGAFHASNAPHSLTLAPGVAGRGDLDFYLLLRGEIAFDSPDGPVRLGGGDMAILRACEPLSSTSREMEMIALALPEHLLGRRLQGGPYAINRAVGGLAALGECLAALLRAAARHRHGLSFEDALVLQSSVVDAALRVAAAGCEAPDASPPAPDRLRGLQRRALQLIRQADLSPRQLADDAGVSVRTVHRLFHASGMTFRDWLRERRLERCREELEDPVASRRTVAEVAFAWGFNVLTTFNRSFRGRFGAAPTALRAHRPARR
jgi:AraC-like DNA-binding protein